jgi:hypothetical protein
MKGRKWERGIVPDCQNENLATLVNCAKFRAMKLLTINQLSLSENALKFTYGNVESQNFPRRTSALRGRNWRGGKIGRKKSGGEGRGWGCGGRKGKAKGEGRDGKTKKDREEKGGGT